MKSTVLQAEQGWQVDTTQWSKKRKEHRKSEHWGSECDWGSVCYITIHLNANLRDNVAYTWAVFPLDLLDWALSRMDNVFFLLRPLNSCLPDQCKKQKAMLNPEFVKLPMMYSHLDQNNYNMYFST